MGVRRPTRRAELLDGRRRLKARGPRRSPESKPLTCRDVLTGTKRMKGLEPSTFCMANASDRSRPFAPVRSNRPFAGPCVQASEREQTRANAEPCHSCHGTQTPSRLSTSPHSSLPPNQRPQWLLGASEWRPAGTEVHRFESLVEMLEATGMACPDSTEHLPATEGPSRANSPRSDQKFAEPVALSSTQPTDRPLPRRASRLSLDLRRPRGPPTPAAASRADAPWPSR
jgi:hypothetical protein